MISETNRNYTVIVLLNYYNLYDSSLESRSGSRMEKKNLEMKLNF